MNIEFKENKLQEPMKIADTMKRFGFVYADVNLNNANSKSDEYEKMGYYASVQHRPDGFYVVVKEKEILEDEFVSYHTS
jgi:hypothetical protein